MWKGQPAAPLSPSAFHRFPPLPTFASVNTSDEPSAAATLRYEPVCVSTLANVSPLGTASPLDSRQVKAIDFTPTRRWSCVPGAAWIAAFSAPSAAPVEEYQRKAVWSF